MPNLLDEINATTLKVILPKKVMDNAFKRKSPLLRKLRSKATVFSGGAFIQQTFLFGKTTGGSYGRGDTFDLTRSNLVDVTKFDLRFYYQNDTQFKEDINVYNKGAAAVFDLVAIHQEAMLLSMNEMLSIDLYRHGQSSGGLVLDNRPTSINGASEALNNGVDNSWDGNVFVTYGKNTRNGSIGAALNCTPYFAGDPTGAAGPITYAILLERYLTACGGDWHPDMLTMNKAAFAYCLERIQPQQRFGQEAKPKWGFEGFSLMGMELMRDEYAPSARFGVNDPKTGNWLTGTFTSVAVPTADSNLPASQPITVGETIWGWNTDTQALYISDDPLYRFGFTGYKEAQNSTIVAGQLLFAGNFIFRAPWTCFPIYGVNS